MYCWSMMDGTLTSAQQHHCCSAAARGGLASCTCRIQQQPQELSTVSPCPVAVMASWFSQWAGPLSATSSTPQRNATTTRRAQMQEVRGRRRVGLHCGCCAVYMCNIAQRAPAPHVSCAAGKAHVYNHGQLRWPNGRFGVCGDPWDLSTKPLEQAGRITGEARPGP